MCGPDGPSFFEPAQQALSSTERGYDLLAPTFDATPFRTPDDLLVQVGDRIRAWETPPRRGLDLCCGTGAGTAMLSRVCTDEVVGLDASAGMLAVAQDRLAADGPPRVHFIRDDALDPRLSDPFHVITCFGAFGHIRTHEQPALLASIRRLLAPTRRFVFLTGYPLGPHRRAWWALHGFNAAIRLRNRLIDPPFHMYYLNFRVPDILPRFEAAGLELVLHPAKWRGRHFIIGEATLRGPTVGAERSEA